MAVLSGGAKLEAYLQELSQLVKEPGELKVGFMGGKTYPNGVKVSHVAIWQEFGWDEFNVRFPPRPFFRWSIAKNEKVWMRLLGEFLKHYKYKSKPALEELAEIMKNDIRQYIVDMVSPELAPATIAKKGHDKLLIDTGLMLDSVDSEVS